MKLYEALSLGKKELLCFVGAGGKTGLMQKLLGECAQQGGRVLVTTSTKMFKSQLTDCCPLILEQDDEKLRRKLLEASAGERILAAAQGLTVNNKVEGLSREAINRLYGSGMFDYILVEADGAKHKALKAPASFEPQVPEQATCVILVAGVDILGRPLTEEYVHRYQIAAKISEQDVGAPVTDAVLLRIFKYYQIIINKFAPQVRIIPVLNKADDHGLQHKAREAAKVLAPVMGRVLITSTLFEEPVRDVVV